MSKIENPYFLGRSEKKLVYSNFEICKRIRSLLYK